MAAVLKPELIWIEGRCYRTNDSNIEISTFQEHDLYENEVSYKELDNEDDDNDMDVVMIDENRFTTSVHVSKHYLGSIIGKRGATKMRIERDTKTEIKIPKQGQAGDIVIYGSSSANVKAARRRMNIIVMSSRMKQKATHFISVPMNDPVVMKNFEIFKERVLRECPSSRGLDESLFIKPHKLHLTLGVMCLMDNEERMHASKFLTEAKENVVRPILQGSTMKIRLKGLSYMNDDPREIDVLYGRVYEEDAETGVLQRLADGIVEHFYKAGYMNKDHGRDNVKLHVTLINSKYRSRSSHSPAGATESPRRTRETFDGSQILQKFADYDFGVVELNHLHLSQRHSMGDDGYYQPTCIISCI